MEQRWSELGDLLRSRRARLEPRFELPGDQRRVPGLRREEVAAAAGVSVAYYTRLEQGRDRGTHDLISGEREHVLRVEGDGFRLARRRVVLDQASVGTKNLGVFL